MQRPYFHFPSAWYGGFLSVQNNPVMYAPIVIHSSKITRLLNRRNSKKWKDNGNRSSVSFCTKHKFQWCMFQKWWFTHILHAIPFSSVHTKHVKRCDGNRLLVWINISIFGDSYLNSSHFSFRYTFTLRTDKHLLTMLSGNWILMLIWSVHCESLNTN